MYTDFLFLIGRILFGGYFVFSGLMHFMRMEMLTQYSASKRVPSPKLATIVTGVMLLLAGLGILFGVYINYAVLLLVIFLIPVSFMMHNFWKETDPNARMMQMTQFMKNMVMLGAALMILAIPQPWMFSLF